MRRCTSIVKFFFPLSSLVVCLLNKHFAKFNFFIPKESPPNSSLLPFSVIVLNSMYPEEILQNLSYHIFSECFLKGVKEVAQKSKWKIEYENFGVLCIGWHRMRSTTETWISEPQFSEILDLMNKLQLPFSYFTLYPDSI